MNIDPSVLSWKDWILVGVIIGMGISARGRRFLGERVGAVEKITAILAKLAGVEEDSNPGRPRRRQRSSEHDHDRTPPDRPPYNRND